VRQFQLFFFSLIIVFGCNTVTHTVTVVEDGHVIESFEINEDSLRHGPMTKYYSAGQLLEQATYTNGELEGIRTLYYENGNPEIIENYCNGIICDTLRTFYKNGLKKLEGVYIFGEMTGTLKGYYDTGELKEEVNFVANEEQGPFVEYYKNGQKKWKGFYLNGPNEFGQLIHYDSTGAIIKKMLCDSIAICQTIWTPEQGDIEIKPVL